MKRTSATHVAQEQTRHRRAAFLTRVGRGVLSKPRRTPVVHLLLLCKKHSMPWRPIDLHGVSRLNFIVKPRHPLYNTSPRIALDICLTPIALRSVSALLTLQIRLYISPLLYKRQRSAPLLLQIHWFCVSLFLPNNQRNIKQ